MDARQVDIDFKETGHGHGYRRGLEVRSQRDVQGGSTVTGLAGVIFIEYVAPNEAVIGLRAYPGALQDGCIQTQIRTSPASSLREAPA